MACVAKLGAKLPEINDLQKKLDEAGVSTNPHTGITAVDCVVQLEQYGTFLVRFSLHPAMGGVLDQNC